MRCPKPFLCLLLLGASLSALCAQKVVCIDPGHPSEVGRGTQGKRITEIKAAWQIAVLLKAKLEARGIKVVLTKTKEGQFVKNRARAEFANAAKADFMVRLHCDADAGTGFASYYPATTGRAQGFTGPSKQVLESSGAKAKAFHAALSRGLKGKLRDNGLKTDRQTAVGAKFGALIGSIFSKVPVVLVEMVVLTNPKDEAFIESKQGQDALASALADGVVAALGQGKR